MKTVGLGHMAPLFSLKDLLILDWKHNFRYQGCMDQRGYFADQQKGGSIKMTILLVALLRVGGIRKSNPF
jgi:hypothetical protein